ncbi:hypothetical protein AB0K74_41760 [Streptomyces sp. NPDC056159]|uniref:hypothetical protein n=1 Tax=unclassified Streptomyces TaxID=2593676 RepID=UPI003446912A
MQQLRDLTERPRYMAHLLPVVLRAFDDQRVASEPEPLRGNGALPTRPAKPERHGRLGRGWRSAVRDGASSVSLVCTVGGDGEQPSAEAGT